MFVGSVINKHNGVKKYQYLQSNNFISKIDTGEINMEKIILPSKKSLLYIQSNYIIFKANATENTG